MTNPTVDYDDNVITRFNAIYADISTTIPFNEKWRWQMSLRGALHDLINKVRIDDGMTVKTIDDLGRKVIFMGTPLGVVTLYVHPLPRKRFKIVYEVPEIFCEKSLFTRASGRLDSNSLANVLSSGFRQAMEEIAQELTT